MAKKLQNTKLSSLFTQEDIDVIKNLIQKSLETATPISTDYVKPTIKDLVNTTLNAPEAKTPTLPLEQQRAILQYAPKDKLWMILDLNNSWYDFLQKGLPKEYLVSFVQRMDDLAIKDPKIVAEMALMFVKSKVSLEHLQAGVSSFWSPDSLEESTQYLYTNGLVQSPRVPSNLRPFSVIVGKIQNLASSPSFEENWKKLDDIVMKYQFEPKKLIPLLGTLDDTTFNGAGELPTYRVKLSPQWYDMLQEQVVWLQPTSDRSYSAEI